MHRALFLFLLVIFISGCASQGESQGEGENPFGVSTDQGGSQGQPQLTRVPLSQLPRASPPQGFQKVYAPELYNLTPLPFHPITFPNDIQVANPAEAGEINRHIQEKFGALLIDSPNPSIVIDYEAYRFSSPTYAQKGLQAYKENWNNKRFDHNNKTLWVWEGCFSQSQPPMPQGGHIFWDENNQVASFSSGQAIVGSFGSDLYCYHGEGVFGPYFVMVDVHAPISEFPRLGEEIFARYLEKINATQESRGADIGVEGGNGSSEENVSLEGMKNLKRKQEEITRAYLEGRVSLKLYNYTLEEIQREIGRINRSSE